MNDVQQIIVEAPILRESMELYKEFVVYLKTFPKKDQYLLGRRCEDYILDFMQEVFKAVSASKQEKLGFLVEANIKFEVLKILFRTARDLRMIDTKKYISLESRVQQIGKMLGGWMRSLNSKTA